MSNELPEYRWCVVITSEYDGACGVLGPYKRHTEAGAAQDAWRAEWVTEGSPYTAEIFPLTTEIDPNPDKGGVK